MASTSPIQQAANARSLAWRLSPFYFAYFGYVGVFGAYFPLWLADRHYSGTQIAAVLALPQLLRIFSPQVWAYFAERLGAIRNLVVLASIAGTLAVGAIALTVNFLEVLLAVGVIGLLTLGVLPLVEATTLATFADRPGSYGPVRLWGSVGSIVAVLSVGTLLDATSNAVLISVLVALMLVVVVASCLLPDRRLAARADVALSDWRKVLGRRDVLVLFIACFCMMMAHGVFFTFFSLYLISFGYSKFDVGLLSTLSVLAEIAAFWRLPWVFRNYSYRAILMTSFAAAVIRFGAIALSASSFAVLAGTQLLHALTFGTFHGASIKLVHRLFGNQLEVRGQALYASLVYGLGGVCGGLVGGLSWQAAGGRATFLLSAALSMVGGIIVTWQLREPVATDAAI